MFRSRRRWRRDAKRTTNFVNSTTMSARRFNGSTERTTASESCVGRRMDRIYSRASVIPPMKSRRYRPTRTTTGRGLTVGHPAGIPAPSSPGVLRPIVGCNSTSNPLLVWGVASPEHWITLSSSLSRTTPIDEVVCFRLTRSTTRRRGSPVSLGQGTGPWRVSRQACFQPKADPPSPRSSPNTSGTRPHQNEERLELLQQTDDTRWSSGAVFIIDDTCSHNTGEKFPDEGKFSDDTHPRYI